MLNHTKMIAQYDSLKARVTFQDSWTESFHAEMKASSSLMAMDSKILFREFSRKVVSWSNLISNALTFSTGQELVCLSSASSG